MSRTPTGAGVWAMPGNHSPAHMARMKRAEGSAGTERTFNASEQAYIRVAWPDWRRWSIDAMMAQLRCSARTLKREAHRLGLGPRREEKPPVKASHLPVRRKNNKRIRDVDAERSSPPPAGIMYACPNPNCGFRSADPKGHAQCQKQEAA